MLLANLVNQDFLNKNTATKNNFSDPIKSKNGFSNLQKDAHVLKKLLKTYG